MGTSGVGHIYIILDACDRREFVYFLCSSGFELISGRLLDTPEIVRFSNADQFLCDDSAAAAFLVRPDYEECPLELQRLPSSGKYTIMPRNGGPTIDISWPWEGILDGERVVRDGSLSHYSSYWNTVLKASVAAPPRLKSAFREVTTFLKKWASKALPIDRVPGRQYQHVWTGPHAASEWRKRHLRLLSYGPGDLALVDQTRAQGSRTSS